MHRVHTRHFLGVCGEATFMRKVIGHRKEIRKLTLRALALRR